MQNIDWSCMSVCLSLAAFPHYCTDPDVTCKNGRGCPVVVHYWVDLQLVHRFHCYDNIARTRNVSECLYSLYVWFLLVFDFCFLSTSQEIGREGHLRNDLFCVELDVKP